MSAEAILNAIHLVARVLPFRLDAYERVNELFAEGRADGSAEAGRLVDVWTYCYVSRYFAMQFLRSGQPSLSDLDRLIERAFIRIRRGAPRLRSPGRYTSWVNTVCRNSYLNYLRSYHLEWLEDPENVVAEAKPTDGYDIGLLADTLTRIIEELPPFLREAARFRFFDGLSYREISERTGQPVPTLRAYANKSLKLIREHPRLKRILDEMGR